MGKRGTRPIPTAIKMARGTHRPDRHGDPACEPNAPLANLGDPPDSLGEHGGNIWRIVGPQLISVGVLTELDVVPFTRYCRANDEVAHCDQVLAEQGDYYVAGESGYIGQHPAVNQRFKWLAEIARFEARFGMSASDRCGIQISKPAKGVATRQRA